MYLKPVEVPPHMYLKPVEVTTDRDHRGEPVGLRKYDRVTRTAIARNV